LSDPIERLFRRLVTNLAALDPASLDRAFPIGDITERLVPYRTHRHALGFDTNEDYELAVLRLLGGERGLAVVTPDDVREAFAREADSTNPDTELFRQFPDALVLLDPDRVAVVLGDAADIAEATAAGEPEPDPRGAALETPPEPPEPRYEVVEPEDERGAEAEEPQLPFLLEEQVEEDTAALVARPRELSVSAPCPFCGGALPVGRTVLFCPHCGQNIGVVHCPTCGAEMDVGWRFCIGCGQKVTGLG
jgi:hypothetical protein